MSRKPTKGYRFFEEWARRNGMRPIARIVDITDDKGEVIGDLLIADSGNYLCKTDYPNTEHDMIWYYRTGYAIDRGDKTWMAGFADYPVDAHLEYAGESRQQKRIEEAVAAGQKMLSQTAKAGLYSGNDNRLH